MQTGNLLFVGNGVSFKSAIDQPVDSRSCAECAAEPARYLLRPVFWVVAVFGRAMCVIDAHRPARACAPNECDAWVYRSESNKDRYSGICIHVTAFFASAELVSFDRCFFGHDFSVCFCCCCGDVEQMRREAVADYDLKQGQQAGTAACDFG